MLDIQRRPYVDAGRQQFLDVVPALRMAAARCVAVRQFIDQHEPRLAREDRIKVHLGERTAEMLDRTARDDLERAGQRLGLGAAMRLDYADHDIGAAAHPGGAFGQHLIGLADSGRRPEKQLQPPARLPRRLPQQCVGIGAEVFVGSDLNGSSRHRARGLVRGH